MKPYYQDSAVTIYHGDCREIISGFGTFEKFDLLLTDPPYGINASRHRNCPKNGWVDYGTEEESEWDSEPPDLALISLCVGKAKSSVIWGGNYFSLPPSMGWFVWDKGQRNFSLADCELAWRATRIFSLSRSEALQDGKQHPTQKPVELMTWCLSKFPKCETIFDPFAGSGTLGRAAKDLGKKATLIERKERYCEIAAKRMAQEVLAL
jgi:site-specific DNA-methyltransferase (adenine-specific)